MREYTTSLFIFRRDLRIDDNSALNLAITCSNTVLPCFIFDPRQILKHPYQSQPALQFMRQSIANLQQAFKKCGTELALYDAMPVEVIKRVFQHHHIQAVFINRDYTPFSRRRDSELAAICQELNIDFHAVPDCLLVEPEQAVRINGSPYQVFTAFYNNARKFSIPLPRPLEKGSFIKTERESTIDLPDFLQVQTSSATVAGGRDNALAILASLDRQAHYEAQRDYPALDATSRLSAHLKFGTCSVREAYYAIIQHLGPEHPLLRQLYWRDFFTHIAFHYPHVFGKAFHSRYDNLVWDNNQDYFEKWSNGMAGFPIVDAGMRELNATGFMHNRVRMIVASFLTKDLHISWRWGERYFAQHLVDYDPAVNNGNWQWAASTGCDAQPYFRIFNPWLQQQKFDPECHYIHRWIPELKGIPTNIIHNWPIKHTDGLYPKPMVDHARESQIAKDRYKNL
jgi:deoxyribodipyrimidine photo-lyase